LQTPDHQACGTSCCWPTFAGSRPVSLHVDQMEPRDRRRKSNDYNVSPSREVLTVVGEEFLPRTRGKSTTVQPHHHGMLFVVVDTRRPEIDSQAVFSLDAVVPGKHESIFVVRPARTGPLRRHRAVLARTAHTTPPLRLRWRYEAIRPFGRVAVRYSLEGKDPLRTYPATFPADVATTAPSFRAITEGVEYPSDDFSAAAVSACTTVEETAAAKQPPAINAALFICRGARVRDRAWSLQAKATRDFYRSCSPLVCLSERQDANHLWPGELEPLTGAVIASALPQTDVSPTLLQNHGSPQWTMAALSYARGRLPARTR
jgi:hypothetical protein